ncbi:MAG: TIGR04219 family outer membrane beta-barrel protein [Pseudomonadales bacterium]
MLKQSVLAVSLLVGAAHLAQADTILGVSSGAGIWQSDIVGDVQDGTTKIDTEDDLGLEDNDNNFFYFALEHPIPVLPNLKLQHTKLSVDGDNLLTREIDFDGSVFPVSDNVSAEADLTHTDATFYYEVLDNWVSLDLGISVRVFDGFVEIQSTSESTREDLDDPIPMLYGKARFDLPLTGLSVDAEANGIGYGGNTLIDASLRVAYESSIGLGVEAGYRSMQLDIDEDIEGDIDLSGVFAGINFHF